MSSEQSTRDTIRRHAREAFKDHQILSRTPTSVTVGREGTNIERFAFYDLPHGVLFAGDLGSAFIPHKSLAWLKGNTQAPEYVAEKLAALEGEKRVYSRLATMHFAGRHPRGVRRVHSRAGAGARRAEGRRHGRNPRTSTRCGRRSACTPRAASSTATCSGSGTGRRASTGCWKPLRASRV